MNYLITEEELKELIESVSIVKSFDVNGFNLNLGNPKEEITKCINKIKTKQPLDFKHILEIIGIIQNDCTIIDSDKDVTVSELRICLAHIHGLCNGLTKAINYSEVSK